MSSRWSKENAQEITLNHPVEYMRFTLIYDGPLHASGGDTADKHKIRKQLHGQLMDVWYNHPTVAGQYERWLKEPEKEREALATLHAGQKYMIKTIDRGHFRFIPLVSATFYLIADLDILFLRRESRGDLINSAGDLDNRIKILFDALRVPKEGELPAGETPADDERHFFCLLEDDSLITSFRVRSERLQDYVGSQQKEKANDVRLVIEVNVKVTRLTYGNLGYGGD